MCVILSTHHRRAEKSEYTETAYTRNINSARNSKKSRP